MSQFMRRVAALVAATKPPVRGSELRYIIGIISDAHAIANNDTYANCEAHITQGLRNLYNLGAKEIISCGDSTAFGSEAEWQLYTSLIAASPFGRAKVHEVNGNHDPVDGFKRYSNNGALVNSEPYFSLDLFGDHYIFMALDTSTNPNGNECFSDAQMTWLEAELATHYGKGKNVFLVEHALFQGWGTGDNLSTPGYHGGLNLGCENHARLKELLISHPNIIMVHGHSHIQLEDRDTWGLEVYAPPEKGGCHQLHVPSLTAQKYFRGAGSLSLDTSRGQSQCWLCKVYRDKIVFIGLNAYTGEEIPNMTYTISV